MVDISDSVSLYMLPLYELCYVTNCHICWLYGGGKK